jgi:hypothetical protein
MYLRNDDVTCYCPGSVPLDTKQESYLVTQLVGCSIVSCLLFLSLVCSFKPDEVGISMIVRHTNKP